MIGLMLILSLAQTSAANDVERETPPSLEVSPVRSFVASHPIFDVTCKLQDIDTDKEYNLTLRQTGGRGVYKGGKARGHTGKVITALQDDLDILDENPRNLTGHRYTDWYVDGQIELTGRGGSLVIRKSVHLQAFRKESTVIGVTAKATRENPAGRRLDPQTLILIGTCDVKWEEQDPIMLKSEQIEEAPQ